VCLTAPIFTSARGCGHQALAKYSATDGVSTSLGICASRASVTAALAELVERKLRFDKPELTLEWDKIQHRERQATIPNIEQSRSITEELRSLR
jgi:hypothetical protein